MKQQAKDAHFGSQMTYYALHIFVLLIQVLYDNDLKLNILNGNIIAAFILVVNIVISTYYFHVTGKTPGFYAFAKKSEMDSEKSLTTELHSQIKNTEHITNADEENQKEANNIEFIERDIETQTNKTNDDSSLQNLTPETWVDYETEKYLMHMDKHGKVHKYFKPKVIKIEKPVEDVKFPKPQKHFCKKCDIWQPFRTRHCNLCEACVSKFDHHCFWVGTCVGELNHGKFFLMLFFFTLEFLQILYYAYTGLSYNDDNYESDHGLKENTYTKQYGAMVISCIIALMFLIFVAILQIMHGLMIQTGSSTWEMTRWEKIDFLNAYPKGFNPFDEGVIKNIHNVFFHNNEIREWTLPDPQEVRNNKQKWNWFSNDYYSCC